MNHVPTLVGTIERRLLVNYRVDPDLVEGLLPSPFRPQVVKGCAIVGICLIRLGHLRPQGLPERVGVRTENAAHRMAVEWDGPEGAHRGVYIPRRHTSSRLTALVGGRVFPGEHDRARFCVREVEGRYDVAFTSVDGTTHVSVAAKAVPELPKGSVFASLADASAFFQKAPLGYSATHRRGRYDGLELQCTDWRVEPLRIEHARSTLFEDTTQFPADAIEFDSALVMRDIPATWYGRGQLAVPLPVLDARGTRGRESEPVNRRQAQRCA
jgi:hypothetical protein